MNRKKIESDLKKANGNRRKNILTLEEIEKIVKKEVEQYKGKKKNLQYLKITNVKNVCKSYGGRCYYTKFVVSLTLKGTIKSIEIWEQESLIVPYGEDCTNGFISIKDIETITNIDLKNVNTKVIYILEDNILNGTI